jgi:signal transduction histidine kinase
MVVDGQPTRLFYRPMEHTGWSIAIVCPDSDVFDSYNRMLNIVWAIIVLFLLLLLLSCYLIIRNAVVPINLLAKSSREITQTITKTSSLSTLHTSPSTWLGGMVSKRVDTIGQLQNSFVRMLQSLNDHVSELHHINAEMEQRNQELQQAYRLAREADERKTSFIQNMTHQVRTPLNIIIGFAQVIATNYPDMSETELTELFDHMKSSVKVVARIVHMLTATSVTNTSTDHSTDIACNTLCRDTVEAISTQVPATLSVVVESTVSDDFTIRTDREAVISILTELFINALRFTPEGSITIACCQQNDDTVLFTVTDTGMGISSENRECIFTPFIKLDSFTEGIGLGLPLSRHTAHLLGGDLTLDETYTDGTRFVLTLPIRH